MVVQTILLWSVVHDTSQPDWKWSLSKMKIFTSIRSKFCFIQFNCFFLMSPFSVYGTNCNTRTRNPGASTTFLVLIELSVSRFAHSLTHKCIDQKAATTSKVNCIKTDALPSKHRISEESKAKPHCSRQLTVLIEAPQTLNLPFRSRDVLNGERKEKG